MAAFVEVVLNAFEELVAERYYPGLTVRKLRDALWATLKEQARLWNTGDNPEQPVQLVRGQPVLSLRYESDYGLIIRKAWGKWEPHEPVHGLTEAALKEAAQDWVAARVLREISGRPDTYTFTIPGYQRIRSGEGWPGDVAPASLPTSTTLAARPVAETGSSGRRFRVALSFAGEKRSLVHEVAHLLAQQFSRERVLYDKFHEAEFARANLNMYLPELYNKEADLVVVVVCPKYDEKEWTGLEWRAIFNLIQQRRDGEVMLCRFERASAAGLHGGEGWVELDGRAANDVVNLILQRLAVNERRPKDSHTRGLDEPRQETPAGPGVQASPPTGIPVFIKGNGVDGSLSYPRWRRKENSGDVDLVADIYFPNGKLLASEDGTTIGTIKRTERTRWRFTAMQILSTDDRTSGDADSEEDARRQLLGAVEKIAPDIRTFFPPETAPATGPKSEARIKVTLTPIGGRREAYLGDAIWRQGPDALSLSVTYFTDPIDSRSKLAPLDGRLGHVKVAGVDRWAYVADDVRLFERPVEGKATSQRDARELLLDEVEKRAPGFRAIVQG